MIKVNYRVSAGVDAGVQGLEEGQCLPFGGGAQVEDTVARPHVFHAHKFVCRHKIVHSHWIAT